MPVEAKPTLGYSQRGLWKRAFSMGPDRLGLVVAVGFNDNW